ncbi:MAG: Rieske 2Fe-2S domain-containing protein [Flavobacteriaceae bacterium]|nr:Rieske 2Fe-2S domain-containing protein [Flavobacteriaceae bacterium]
MERRKFIKTCCITAVGLPILASTLHSCASAIHYATVTRKANRLVVKKTAFITIKNNKEIFRDFVLVKTEDMSFPICLYKTKNDTYVASLLKCTHRGCELNVGGGIYTCPCHGSEFTVEGNVLEGPAEKKLKTFETIIDDENIYIIQA